MTNLMDQGHHCRRHGACSGLDVAVYRGGRATKSCDRSRLVLRQLIAVQEPEPEEVAELELVGVAQEVRKAAEDLVKLAI